MSGSNGARMANRESEPGPKQCDKCTQKIVNIIIDIVASESTSAAAAAGEGRMLGIL